MTYAAQLAANIVQEFGEQPIVVLIKEDWEKIVEAVKSDPAMDAKLKESNLQILTLERQAVPNKFKTGQGPELAEDEVMRDLGVVTVTPDGSGLYGTESKPVKIRLFAVSSKEDTQRDDKGVLEYAGSASLYGYFDLNDWNADVEKDNLLYTDAGVEDQINAYLRLKGIEDAGGWSEHGMQGANYIHFDLRYGALEQIFPNEPNLKFEL